MQKKTILSILFFVLLTMTVTGCGKETSTQSNKGLDSLIQDYGFQWTDPEKPILNNRGAEEISFTIYSSKNASALDYNDMKVMQDLFEATNVSVDWSNVSESVYAEQKNLIFSNQANRPDAIYHAGMSAGEIIKYAQREVILPISDYLEYMPNLSAILEERPDIYNQLINVKDGKIYALPRIEEMGLLQNPNILFLNKNWAAAAIDAGAVSGVSKESLTDGLSLTCDQMEAFLKYFKENDMNGNGNSEDERPLSFVYNNWQGNQCDLYGMFGLNDNLEHRVIIDDKVVYTILDDRFKEATNFIVKWVDAGYIDKVSFEQSQDNFLANGKGLEKYGAFYWWESDTVVDNDENYIVCAPLIGPNGEQTVCVSNNPEVGTGEVIVFSDCKNPEVLLAYFDRFYDPYVSAQINYGPIGIVYEEETDAQGKLVQKAIPEGVTTDELRLQNAPLGIIYLSDYAWNNIVNMEPRAQLRVERLADYVRPYVGGNVKPCPNLQFTLDELNVLGNYETNFNDYVRSKLISWLINGGISDSEWDTFQNEIVSKCKLDEIQTVYQNAYDRFIGKQ